MSDTANGNGLEIGKGDAKLRISGQNTVMVVVILAGFGLMFWTAEKNAGANEKQHHTIAGALERAAAAQDRQNCLMTLDAEERKEARRHLGNSHALALWCPSLSTAER